MARCVNEYPECTALEGTWSPFACWLNSYRRAPRAPGAGGSKAWRSRSLGKGTLQGHLWDSTFRGRGSAFAQPHFEVSRCAEGVVGHRAAETLMLCPL